MDDIKITDSPIYVCEVCNKFFYDRPSLDLHFKIHSDYSCQICLKKFNEKDQLINHIRSSPCKKRFPCEFCNKMFKDENTLKCHLITHKEARKFVCKICKKAFRYSHVLVIHSNVCHLDKKPFTCDFCNEAFSTKSKLKSHIKEHKKESKLNHYICDISKKKVKKEKTVELSCKTDEKPFVCAICQKAFSAKSSLTRHSVQHNNNNKSKLSSKEQKVCKRRLKFGKESD